MVSAQSLPVTEAQCLSWMSFFLFCCWSEISWLCRSGGGCSERPSCGFGNGHGVPAEKLHLAMAKGTGYDGIEGIRRERWLTKHKEMPTCCSPRFNGKNRSAAAAVSKCFSACALVLAKPLPCWRRLNGN